VTQLLTETARDLRLDANFRASTEPAGKLVAERRVSQAD
jgi:hypothetical protein